MRTPGVQLANDSAAAAARAWLITSGLAAEIEAVRFPEGFGPVPAPGCDQYLEAADQAAAGASLAATRAAILAEDPAADDAFYRAVDEARDARQAAELASRRMAQLALGVSARLIGDDRIERLDRAAVAVVSPPLSAGRATDMVRDGVHFTARNRRELVVELAGVICRLLVERRPSLQILGPRDASVALAVSEGDVLVVTTPGGRVDPDDGWRPMEHGGYVAQWESPVTVSGPSHAVASLLLGEERMSAGAVTCVACINPEWS